MKCRLLVNFPCLIFFCNLRAAFRIFFENFYKNGFVSKTCAASDFLFAKNEVFNKFLPVLTGVPANIELEIG